MATGQTGLYYFYELMLYIVSVLQNSGWYKQLSWLLQSLKRNLWYFLSWGAASSHGYSDQQSDLEAAVVKEHLLAEKELEAPMKQNSSSIIIDDVKERDSAKKPRIADNSVRSAEKSAKLFERQPAIIEKPENELKHKIPQGETSKNISENELKHEIPQDETLKNTSNESGPIPNEKLSERDSLGEESSKVLDNSSSVPEQLPIPFRPALHQKLDYQAARHAAESLNNFALKLNQVFHQPGKNCAISPFSIFNALGLALEGAQGNTQKQILRTLNFKHDLSMQAVRYQYYNFISQVLFDTKKSFKLFSANRLYGDSNLKFSADYKRNLQQYYNSDIIKSDFTNDAEKERGIINEWVQKVTNDQIKELLPEGSVSDESIALLVNALYFEGSWDFVFDENLNEMRDFRTGTGEVKQVETMVQKMMNVDVMRDFSECDKEIKRMSIKLPYDRRTADMHIVLPLYTDEDLIGGMEDGSSKKPKKTKIQKLLEDLDEQHIEHITRYGDEEFVDLYLPKFSLEFTTLMSKPLIQLGITDAFNAASANFSGMIDKAETGSDAFYISEGFHKTKIIVNETGTVAASATALGKLKGLPPRSLQFEVNQPFLFLIVHSSSKSILFSGVVEDPTQN